MCCAVGEGFGDDGSTAPGARIWCTSDYGAHWNQTFFKAEVRMRVLACVYNGVRVRVGGRGVHYVALMPRAPAA